MKVREVQEKDRIVVTTIILVLISLIEQRRTKEGIEYRTNITSKAGGINQ